MRKQQFEALLRSGLSQPGAQEGNATPVTPVSISSEDKALFRSLSALAHSERNSQGICIADSWEVPPCF
ncbi:MAG: hypothetical protein BGO63_10500 [Candidatus Accumulibacter sp. 66-26]|nr:MAG: hypothetical protein BGO63_10500 [Candidatus Accumulibacter sp. 66-26]